MNIFTTINNKKLHLLLLLSLASHAYGSSQETIPTPATDVILEQTVNTDNQQEIEKAQIEDALFAELHNDLLRQINMQESICDTFGQINATEKEQRNSATSQDAQALLFAIRGGLANLKEENSLYVCKEQVISMAYIASQMTDILDQISTYGLENFVKNAKSFKPKPRSITINADTVKTLEATDIKKLVIEIDKDLKTVINKADELGLTTTNKVYRKIRSVWSRYNLGPVTERLVTYPAIFCWSVFMMPESTLKALPGSSLTLPIKKYLMGNEVKPKEKIDHTGTALVMRKIINPETGEILKEEVVEKPVLTIYADGKKKPLFTKVESSQDFKTDVSKVPNGYYVELNNKASQDPTLSGDSIVNKIISYVSPLLTLEGGAYYKLPISALVFNYLKNDAIILNKQFQKLKAVLDDKLRGSVKQRKFTDSSATGTDRFKDVVGRDYIKAELKKIIDYVCYPEKYDRTNFTVEKGILFSGPSQNGKSAMVRAFSNELTDALAKAGKPTNFRLWNISVQEIIESVPATEKYDGKAPGLSFFVKIAEKMGQPVIIVIDEFDMLSVQRGQDNKMLADVLTAMSSGLSASEKNMVIIIGLTNRPQNLDFALLQHGRFGKQFKFEKPTYNERCAFFIKECERRTMDPNRFDIKKLAHETEGVSFGTLIAVTKRAFLLAKVAGVGVKQEHFEHALDTEVKNIVFTGEELPRSKQEIIATHCAGKALVSVLLQPSKALCKVTTLPCTQEIQEEHVHQSINWDKSPILKVKEQNIIRYGNIFAYAQEDTLDMEVHEELIKQCKILIAGNVAQKVSNLDQHVFDKKDKEEAFALARKITFEGLEVLQGMPKKASEELLTEAVTLLKTYEHEVSKLLTDNKKALNALSKELLEKKILTAQEVSEIIAAHK